MRGCLLPVGVTKNSSGSVLVWGTKTAQGHAHPFPEHPAHVSGFRMKFTVCKGRRASRIKTTTLSFAACLAEVFSRPFCAGHSGIILMHSKVILECQVIRQPCASPNSVRWLWSVAAFSLVKKGEKHGTPFDCKPICTTELLHQPPASSVFISGKSCEMRKWRICAQPVR